MQTEITLVSPATVLTGPLPVVEYKRHADDTTYMMVCMDAAHKNAFIEELCADMNVVEIDGEDLTVMP